MVFGKEPPTLSVCHMLNEEGMARFARDDIGIPPDMVRSKLETLSVASPHLH